METPQEIKSHLRSGDYAKVGKIAGVSRVYAHKLMNRPNAKKHKDVLQAALQVATANLNLGL